eukprot:524756_1
MAFMADNLLLLCMILVTLPFVFSSNVSCVYNTNRLPTSGFGQPLSYHAAAAAVYLFGGAATQSTFSNYISKWNANTQEWIKLNVTIPAVYLYSQTNNAVTINDKVYFIGIYDGTHDSGKIYVFNMKNETWTDNINMASPNYPGVYGCLATNDSHIFMIGGWNGTDALDYLQIYDINDNSWYSEEILISPILGNGWRGQYCSMSGNVLYVFAGVYGAHQYDNGIYKYDVISKWTKLGNLLPLAYGVAVNYYNKYIYLIGGGRSHGSVDQNVTVIDIIYEFDLSSESITNTLLMNESLTQMSAIIIADKIHIFGGWNGTHSTSSTEICDVPGGSTISQRFEELNNVQLPLKMHSFCSGILNGQIFTLHGETVSNDAIKSISHSLDFYNNSWITKTDANTPFNASVVAYYGQSCVSYGSLLFGVPYARTLSVTMQGSNFFKFNLNNHVYIDIETYDDILPQKAKSCCITIAKNQLFVIGGADIARGTILASVQSYDISNNQWINKTSLNVARHQFGCSINGEIENETQNLYVFGGQNTDGTYIDSIEKYSILDDTWSELNATLQISRGLFQCIFVVQYIYCVGGQTHGSIKLSSAEIFNPVNDQLLNTISLYLNTPRSYHVVIKTNDDNILVLGGKDGNGATDSIERISFFEIHTENPTASPTTYTSNPTIPTVNPVIVPTNGTQQIETSNVTPSFTSSETYNEQAISEQFETITLIFQYVNIVIIGLFLLIAISGYMHSKYYRINDFFRVSFLIQPLFHYLDAISDSFSAFEVWTVYNETDDSFYFIMMILMISFILIPILFSVSQLITVYNKQWSNRLENSDVIKVWFGQNSYILYGASIVTGNAFSAVGLFNSNLYSLSMFDMGLPLNVLIAFKVKRIYSIVLCENIPQLFLQFFYLYKTNGHSVVAVISMTYSVVSILLTLITIYTQKTVLYSQSFMTIKLNVYGTAITNNAKSLRYRTHKLRTEISSLLGVEEPVIDVMKTKIIANNGLQIAFMVKVNVNKHSNIERTMQQSKDNGKLESFVQKGWDLNGYDSVEVRNLIMNNEECQQAIDNTVHIQLSNINKNTNTNAIVPVVIPDSPNVVDVVTKGYEDSFSSDDDNMEGEHVQTVGGLDY